MNTSIIGRRVQEFCGSARRILALRPACPAATHRVATHRAATYRAATYRTATYRTATFVLVFSALTAVLVPAARADYAVLSGGQRLHITGWQRVGDSVRLDMDGGSVTVPAGELISVEPEELFPASATPAPQPELPYGEQIRTSALRNGVDPLLVASIISVESNFNSRAISRKSAFGLMQLRPRTAAELSVRNLFDPAQNIEAGTHYLKQLLDRYNQNLPLALAAYNAGPNRVAQYRGVPPFAETQDYIRRVKAGLEKQKSANRSMPLWPLALPAKP